MNRALSLLSIAAVLAGLVLPPGWLAGVAAGGREGLAESLYFGAWITKGSLVLVGVLLWTSVRWTPREGLWEPLVRSGIREPGPGSASIRWGIGGLLVLATALRLHRLELGLWYDEIDTLVSYGRAPLAEILTTFDSQNQHLLYSVLARLSILALGESAFALRLPAAVLGIASIWAAWRLVSLVADRREALFAAALLVVSYHHVWFSQNARGYTGLLLFTTLGSVEFLRLLAARRPEGVRRPLAYASWMTLAVLTHATAVLAVAAHFLVWIGASVAARGRPVGPNRWIAGLGFQLAGALSLLAYSLVLPQFVETLTAPTMPGAETEWKDPFWLVRETLAGLAAGLPGGWLALVAAGAVVGLGLWSYARRGPAVLAVFLLGPAVTAAALVATGHNLWPRFFFFAAAGFVAIALRGASTYVELFTRGSLSSMTSPLRNVVFTLICLTSAATLPRAYAPKQDFLGARAFVEGRRGPGDAVATLDMTDLPYREWLDLGWTSVASIEDLIAVEAAHERTWIVYSTPTRLAAEHPELWERLQADYAVAETFWGTVRGLELHVAVRSEP